MGTRDTIFSKRHVATRTQGIAFAIWWNRCRRDTVMFN
jgi:hypothetical protein